MKTDKEKAVELWQDQMYGSITPEEEIQLNAMLEADPQLHAELQEMEQTWHLFDQIERPSPSGQMDARFEGMLAAYSQTQSKRFGIIDQLIAKLAMGWQVGLASLFLGLVLGWFLIPTQSQQQDLAQLSSEIHTMKEMMMLTLIEQPKAQERIRAVNMAAELPQADQKVIDALVFTLSNDQNVNVRLAALESVIRYTDRPEVRQALVDALRMQNSPLMLVAIADALVAIQEKSSLDVLEQLKDQTDDEIVREKLSQSITTLRNI